MIIIVLTLYLVAADDICIQNSYFNIGQPIDAVGDKSLLIRLQGEFLVGYGDDYHILDKNKILLIPQEEKMEYRATNLEVYCPGRHLIEEEDKIQCEIVLNLLTKSETEYQSAILIIPVEEDDEIRTNPLLKIDNDFEIHLSDLAEQLDDFSYYLEYVNCGSQYYLLPDAIEITAEQMAQMIKYATKLPDDAPQVGLETYQGTLRIENFTTNQGSNVHLYGLVIIIAGVLILTAIRAFKKHEEPQQQNQQQLIEMPKLG